MFQVRLHYNTRVHDCGLHALLTVPVYVHALSTVPVYVQD